MNFGFGELVIVFLVVLFVFGAGRIPKIARDLGLGIREFKGAMSGNDGEDTGKKSTPAKIAGKKKSRA
ncbi:MAG TPA: twin-arginine translocase TatA/TatE family subunit [Spirochaetota bacterium]|nr:twin-arginine translocase TatA/TatE family subunit [Spirochaetota bacterium]